MAVYGNSKLDDNGNVKYCRTRYSMFGRWHYSSKEAELSFKKDDLRDERRAGLSKEKYAFWSSLLGGIGGAGVTVGGGVFANAAENAARKEEYIESIRPELEAETEDMKAILNERYPLLDTSKFDSTNIVEGLRKAFHDCFTRTPGGNIFQDDTLTIIPGWERYYVDWRNGNLSFVHDKLEALISRFDHYPLIDSIKDMVPAGVGAVALTVAVVAVPTVIHKLKAHRLEKQIARLEAEQVK